MQQYAELHIINVFSNEKYLYANIYSATAAIWSLWYNLASVQDSEFYFPPLTAANNSGLVQSLAAVAVAAMAECGGCVKSETRNI